MELINLNSPSLHKLRPAINKAGGRYSIAEKIKLKGIGISGLEYYSGLHSLESENYQQHKISVTLELYKAGIGFYFRNIDINYATVLPLAHIERIVISKKEDTILDSKNVFYKTAKIFTSDYLIVRNFLLENEKIDFHPIVCEFYSTFSETIAFEISALRPQKVIDFLKRLHNLQIEIDIKDHKIINGK